MNEGQNLLNEIAVALTEVVEVEIVAGRAMVDVSTINEIIVNISVMALKAQEQAEESGRDDFRLVALGQTKVATIYQTLANAMLDKAELAAL
jgi:hypothetical protein